MYKGRGVSACVPLAGSCCIDIEATLTDTDRPPSPAMSRDGSVTPTPEDLDTGEPLTPKKTPEGKREEFIIWKGML